MGFCLSKCVNPKETSELQTDKPLTTNAHFISENENTFTAYQSTGNFYIKNNLVKKTGSNNHIDIEMKSPRSRLTESRNSELKFEPNVRRPDEQFNIKPQNERKVAINEKVASNSMKGLGLTKSWTLSRPEDKINLYDHAQSIFESINSIRTEPFKYFGKLHKIFDLIKVENNIPFIQFEHFTYYFKENIASIKNSEEFLKSLSPSDSRKLEDVRHATLWIEKIYNECVSNLENLDETETVFFEKIAKNYQYECESKRTVIDGLMEPETTALLILIDNLKDRETLFTKSFDVGACACKKTNDSRRIQTELVLVDIIYPGEKERRDGKKVKKDNTPNGPSISLDHPAFDNITYKDLIVDGDFSIEGNLIKAQFVLNTGETKHETINM